MTAASAQIYQAAAKTTPDQRIRHAPATSMQSRTQELTTGSRWRFNKSTASLATSETSASVPTANSRTPKLERTVSKMSLFNLFSRPKVEKARGHTEVGLAVPMRPQTPPKPTPPISVPKSSLRQNPSPSAQQTIRARSSQMFRQSMRPATPSLVDSSDWDPPPLFQAFPQSLKHATVQACIFPPEVLMRTQSQRRQAELLRERMDSARDLSTITENSTEIKKLEKSHRRLVSNSVLNPPAPELVNKIYILATAGYVLQYSGDGPFDRTPEKVLRLGKDSAAFACDLIPGKHWVLQISSHAHNDGTVGAGPRSSLISRLRSQNSASRKAATSFLLVLDSPEEMDAWMTAVRKEIDSLGGLKPRDGSERASSSTDELREKKSVESFSRRYLVQRDPNKIGTVGAMDSPHRGQRSESPKVVTSDWEMNRDHRAVSVADSSSGQSSKWVNGRQSTEMSSIASTPVSQHQIQLDQIRGRSRSSFMSAITTTSGVLTQNTSRDSSPAPQSPLKEDFLVGQEAEPLRSAKSLKSFHMNPSNNSASRRRSMQPLPITNEDFPQAMKAPAKKERHSLYIPTSPPMPGLEKHVLARTTSPVTAPSPFAPVNVASEFVLRLASPTPSISRKASLTESISQSGPDREHTRIDSPFKHNLRNFSVPPRGGTISPPPMDPAPLPPPSAKRQSVLYPMHMSMMDNEQATPAKATSSRPQRRLSSTPKPFLRPLPVRPQPQHIDGSVVIPRRQSSLVPASVPAPLPLGVNVNRSVTAPVRTEAQKLAVSGSICNPKTLPLAQSSQALHRPNPVQARTGPGTGFSGSRSARVISSTPSFLPGRRANNASTSAPRPTVILQSPPSIDELRHRAQAQEMENRLVHPRRSLPAMALPPPAPPPNMALPPLPPSISAPTSPPSIPLPSLPVHNPVATRPPTMPLPALPSTSPLPSASSSIGTNPISV